ncbi:MAG: hypothetical protein IJM57_03030 [Lachnospiraceae bacterium]|nr:hypothetical protein [Lachnospiraceae bacterium]
MSADGKKRNGTKEVLETARAAERGVSGQKRQEIFAAYARLREEMLSGPADAGQQEKQLSGTVNAKPQGIFTLSELCRRASAAAAAIVVLGVLFFVIGKITTGTSQPKGEELDEDTATALQFTESKDYNLSPEPSPGVTRPGETEDSAWMAEFDFVGMQEMTTDRIEVTAERILAPYREAEWDGTAQALCLVTLQSIDLSGVGNAQGTHAPITLRIDRICQSTADFDRTENDVIVTQDRSFWFAKENGYVLNHPQGEIPMTEVGAQYIVTIARSGDDATYTVSAHTIPIDGQSRVLSGDYGPLVWGSVRIGDGSQILVPREKIYKKMALGDDVVCCSEELIRRYVEGGESAARSEN